MGVGVAILAGTAIGLAEVAATVAVIGTVMSVAGMITHNKTLSTIGMVLGLAGGIGAAFAPATTAANALFAGTSGIAGETTSIAATAADTAIANAGQMAPGAGVLAPTSDAASLATTITKIPAGGFNGMAPGAGVLAPGTPTSLSASNFVRPVLSDPTASLVDTTKALANPADALAKPAAQGLGAPGANAAGGVATVPTVVTPTTGNALLDGWGKLDSATKIGILQGTMTIGGSVLGAQYQAASFKDQQALQRQILAQQASFRTQSMAPAGIISYAHPTAPTTPTP